MKQQSAKIRLVIGFALLVLIAFNSIKGNNQSFILFLYLINFIFAGKKEKILLMLASLPLQSSANIMNLLSIVTCEQIIYLISFLLKPKNNLKINLFITILIIFLLQLLSISIFNSNYLSFFNVIGFVIALITMILLSIECRAGTLTYEEFAYSVIGGLLLASLVMIVFDYGTIKGLLLMDVKYRYFGYTYNANTSSAQYLIALGFIIVLLLQSNFKRSVIYLMIFGFFCVFLVISISRSTIYALILMIVLYMIHLVKLKNGNIKKTILLLSTICLTLFLNTFVIGNIVQKRGFISSNQADWTNGRILNTTESFSYIINRNGFMPLVFGYGTKNLVTIMRNEGLETGGTHNTFLEIFISCGLLGSIFWLYLMFSTFKQNKSFFKTYYAIPIYVMLIIALVSNFDNSDFVYLLLPIIIIKRVKCTT